MIIPETQQEVSKRTVNVQPSLINAEDISSQLSMPMVKQNSSQDDQQKIEIQIISTLILKRKSSPSQVKDSNDDDYTEKEEEDES